MYYGGVAHESVKIGIFGYRGHLEKKAIWKKGYVQNVNVNALMPISAENLCSKMIFTLK